MRRGFAVVAVAAVLVGFLGLSGSALPESSWQAGWYQGELVSSQGIVPQPVLPPNAAGIRGANDVGLGVDIVVANAQEQPQNRFHFGQEIRFLFDSGPGPASVYIFGIGAQGEILYASSSHQPVPPGIKRYPPDALLFGAHGPITASPPIGVSTFQIVVSSQPLEVLSWQRWIAPPERPPVPVSKLLTIIEVLPVKYGAENVGFDFTQFCAEPPGGNFLGCPLGPPETLQPVQPPVIQPPPRFECQGQSLAQYDTYSEGRYRYIDDPEFFRMIDDWVSGRLCDPLFFSAIDLWVEQKRIPDVISLGAPALRLTRTGLGVTFQVQGASQLQVAVHDLSGRLLWQERTFGQQLSWRQLDESGQRVGNGVYLAVITAQIGGQPQRWLKKLAVVR